MTNTTQTAKSGAQQKASKNAGALENSGGSSVKEAAAAARETAEATIETVRGSAQDTIEKVQETGQQVYDDGSQMVSKAQSELNRTVRNNPTVAMLGALGVGVLIGLALKQRF